MDETLDHANHFNPVRGRGATTLALFGVAAGAFLSMTAQSGCTAAQQAKVRAATNAVVADAKSPAGQAILADVTSAALNAGLDTATGNDTGAVIAGIQGAASAMRDYEGLPTAPSSAVIAAAAAAGSGVAKVASLVAPSIETIINHATQSAQTQQVSLSVDAITEAAARGLDAVASAKYVPPAN